MNTYERHRFPPDINSILPIVLVNSMEPIFQQPHARSHPHLATLYESPGRALQQQRELRGYAFDAGRRVRTINIIAPQSMSKAQGEATGISLGLGEGPGGNMTGGGITPAPRSK